MRRRRSLKGSSGAANERAPNSFQLRLDAAEEEAEVPASRQIANGGEQTYSNFSGNYHKGLPHHAIGKVTPSAYQAFLSAGAPWHI